VVVWRLPFLPRFSVLLSTLPGLFSTKTGHCSKHGANLGDGIVVALSQNEVYSKIFAIITIVFDKACEKPQALRVNRIARTTAFLA